MVQATTEEKRVTLGTLVKDSAIYNLWANRTLVDWLKSKPAVLMDEVVPSSFPSLKETLVHIWDTQRFWQSVLQQVPAPPSFRIEGFHGSLEEVFEGIVDQSLEMALYIESLEDTDLTEEVEFDTPWVSGKQARFEFIYHCLNHSTYHRGQLITMGRVIGLTDAPMTDYNFYLLRVK
jgi:uncharacterized damage-inducible protein DinB